MESISAQRTLVKSPPELWAKLSDAAELARHLEDDFGEIRITRVEAERTLVWEGDAARGTVELEASGWGTKVTLTAEPAGAAPERPRADPAATITALAPTLESKAVETTPSPPRRAGFLARILGRLRPAPMATRPVSSVPSAPMTTRPASSVPSVPVATDPEPDPAPPSHPTGRPASERAARVLETVLDDLGSAHHRPFSRG